MLYPDICQNILKKDYGVKFSGDNYVNDYSYTKSFSDFFCKSKKSERMEILKKMYKFIQDPKRFKFMTTNRKGQIETRLLKGKRMYVKFDENEGLLLFLEISAKNHQKDKQK